jgi:glycosyltransferase involved in cell wall biosynthesis
MPGVSVIIPTYNHAESLPQTVGSILQQTHPPLEVIIVDDGSKDHTESVCAAMPEPVRYIRQENAGVSAARNRGIAEARGEWVALADSDDLWDPGKLEVQLAALACAPGARWCATDCHVIGPDGAPVPGRQGFQRAFAIFAKGTETPESFFRAGFLAPRSGQVDRAPVLARRLFEFLCFTATSCFPLPRWSTRGLRKSRPVRRGVPRGGGDGVRPPGCRSRAGRDGHDATGRLSRGADGVAHESCELASPH